MAALVNFSFLALLVEVLGLWYLTAATIAFTAALLVSFSLQKFFTFADHSRANGILARQFSIYTTVALANVAINTALMYLLVEFLSVHYLVSQAAASATIALYSFFVYRALFGRVTPQNNTEELPHENALYHRPGL